MAPKLPPMVAPMNSDGEKMPPEAPEPRLVEVAKSFATKRKTRKQASKGRVDAKLPGQDRFDGRVADALDIVMADPYGSDRSAPRSATSRCYGADTGFGMCSKTVSVKCKPRMNPADATPINAPSTAKSRRVTAA